MNFTRVIIFIPLLISSCASIETEYPASWAKLTSNSNQECPNVSGLYLNKGLAAPSNPKPDYLSSPHKLQHLFFPSVWKPNVKNVNLLLTKNKKLQVSLMANSKVEYKNELIINKEEFNCENGFLSFYHEENHSTEGGSYTKTYTVNLYIDKNKNLVAKVIDRQSGFAMGLIPYGHSKSYWYLYSPNKQINKDG